MAPLSLRLSLIFAAALALATSLVAPQGMTAARWLVAQDFELLRRERDLVSLDD